MWSRFLQVFKDIDEREFDADDQSRSRIPIALTVAGVCLLLVHYLKFDDVFLYVLELYGRDAAIKSLGEYRELSCHLWWSFMHLIAFLVIPLVTIKWILKDSFSHYHLGWGDVHKHWLGYLALLSPIMIFIILVTVFRDDFSQHYPFYSHAGRSVFDFVAWELSYIIQFIALEFFFRGFLLGACKRQLGSNAIFVMMLPYLMLHFPKLWLEASGALLFGLFLGMLALRSRSIWGGVLVHVTIAVSMDIAALIKRGDIF